MKEAKQKIKKFLAIITDLDGVVTRTAALHATSWKQMFDEYLGSRRSRGDDRGTEPFSIEQDYVRYVDGKPRYAGAQSFLQSRGIELPYGNPKDEPGRETVCGLGNRKNEYFQVLLQEKGPSINQDSVAQLHAWKEDGLKLALVSSSKNGRRVLDAARLTPLFDIIIDGNDAEHAGLSGKPHPDLFLHAAEQLGVQPQEAVVIEDAVSGIQAGAAGGFGCVVGIAQNASRADALKNAGAEYIVSSLKELDFIRRGNIDNSIDVIPSALQQWEEITGRLENRRPAVFLDYDGTLTPIVPHPDQALLSPSMRKVLLALTPFCTIAVISGRDLSDVRKKVGIDSIVYAGSHGFDIAGPDELQFQFEQGKKCLPALESAARELREALGTIPGILIESKRFAIAVHYRNVPESQIRPIELIVDQVQSRHPSLRKRGGKKIFELLPDIEWDKGRAILWLLQVLHLDRTEVILIYLGDDVTDEDAFRAIADRGIGIFVGDSSSSTAAQYDLADVGQVEVFLSNLIEYCRKRGCS